jgi:hypothetical protein
MYLKGTLDYELWYLKGTLDYGLWYLKGEYFNLKAYTNGDWEGCVDDQKSTSGGALFVGNFLVSWLRKQQSTIYFKCRR